MATNTTETETSLTLDVHVVAGGTDGTVDLPAELFDVTPNVPLMHQVVVAQLAAARQGTHATKTRGEVRGGGLALDDEPGVAAAGRQLGG